MLTRLSLLAAMMLAAPLYAQNAQFTLEMRDVDGERVANMLAQDEGFKIRYFDPDLMEVGTNGWTVRWSGRFENEASPSNLGLIRNNTFIKFNHPDLGEVTCRPSDEEDEPNSWTRSINREALKSGFLNFKIVSCADPSGADLEAPGLPYAVSATYILEQ